MKDDKPVFEDERFYCAAFKEGGLEKEQEARIEWRRQKQQEHYENHVRFRQRFMNGNFLDNFNPKGKENDQSKSQVNSLLDSGSENSSQYDSYYTGRSEKTKGNGSKHSKSFSESLESDSINNDPFDELD